MSVGLENKAKFLHELLYPITLYDECKGCSEQKPPYANCHRYFSGFCQKTAKDKLVLLADAQKEIADRDILIKKLQSKLETEPVALANQLVVMTNKAVEAEAKVEAANKKLDKEIKEYSNNTMRPAIHDEFIIVLKNIKKSLEIPRKEEAEK